MKGLSELVAKTWQPVLFPSWSEKDLMGAIQLIHRTDCLAEEQTAMQTDALWWIH